MRRVMPVTKPLKHFKGLHAYGGKNKCKARGFWYRFVDNFFPFNCDGQVHKTNLFAPLGEGPA